MKIFKVDKKNLIVKFLKNFKVDIKIFDNNKSISLLLKSFSGILFRWLMYGKGGTGIDSQSLRKRALQRLNLPLELTVKDISGIYQFENIHRRKISAKYI